jgi:hypothetical protein
MDDWIALLLWSAFVLLGSAFSHVEHCSVGIPCLPADKIFSCVASRLMLAQA